MHGTPAPTEEDAPDAEGGTAGEELGLRVEVLERHRARRGQGADAPAAGAARGRRWTGERAIHLCLSSLLLAYFAGVGFLILEGLVWIVRGVAG